MARPAAVDRLPDQIGEWDLRVLAPSIGDVLRDQGAQFQPLDQLAHKDQAAVRGDPRALEFDAESGVERELKGGTSRCAGEWGPPELVSQVRQRSARAVEILRAATRRADLATAMGSNRRSAERAGSLPCGCRDWEA